MVFELKEELENILVTERSACCHNGVFHADDVFSAALIRLVFGEDIKFMRVPVAIPGAFNFDIGFGRYDHHYDDESLLRPNGEKYASFGLLWKDFGERLCDIESEEVKREFVASLDNSFVSKIDYTDNTGDRNPLSASIKALNPTYDMDSNGDAEFEIAVGIATQLLSAQIRTTLANLKSTELFKALAEESEDGLVILDAPMPCSNAGSTKAKLLVYPSARGGYNLSTVSKNRIPKVPFPNEWKSNMPLGMTFLHPAMFLAAFETLETAVLAAKNLLTAEGCANA